MYTEGLLRHIQVYPGIFRTLCNPHIFTILPYSKPCHIKNQRHIQNPVKRWPGIVHNPALFRHIQKLVLPSHMQEPDIFWVLEYSEPFHNCIPLNHKNSELWHIDFPAIFRTLTYFKPNTYSELSQRVKMECFKTIVKSYNYFSKVLYLRSLTGFWICRSLNKVPINLYSDSTSLEPCVTLPYSESWHI